MTVYDGVDALAYLDAGNYDALILDIMMPPLEAGVGKVIRAGGGEDEKVLWAVTGRSNDLLHIGPVADGSAAGGGKVAEVVQCLVQYFCNIFLALRQHP